MKRLAVIAVAAALLGGAVLAYASHRAASNSFGNAPALAKRVHVKAHVRGLYPGARKDLRVRIRNPHQRRAILRRLAVKAHRAGAGCPASTLRIRRHRHRVKIRRHTARTLKIPIRMSPLASDACQGRRFRLRVHYRLREGP